MSKKKKRESYSSFEDLGKALGRTGTNRTGINTDQPPGPNPFDFVPFQERPNTYKPNTLENDQDILSGYITVKLTAKTPVHIVGYQEPEDENLKIKKSYFYKEDGKYCIPGSSIRGTLRSFIEALTNGWISQATEKFKKGYKERHIGYSTFEKYSNTHKNGSKTIVDPVISPEFKSESSKDGKVDIATYLFGNVYENKNEDSAESLKSRVTIEDALLENICSIDKCFIPDIEKTILGGAHPSKSSWWYMLPHEVWNRHVKVKIKGNWKDKYVAEFVGNSYRGRKFYYHQDPVKCVKWYQDNWAKLNKANNEKKSAYYKYLIEAMKAGQKATFRIYLNRLPKNLFIFLCLCLCPGDTIRHKLGYGKAFGYGSVEFSIEDALIRKDEVGFPKPLESWKDKVDNWLKKGWQEEKISSFININIINRQALNKLAKILGWPPLDNIIFAYPPFSENYFKSVVKYDSFEKVAKNHGIKINNKPVTDIKNNGKDITNDLFNKKRAIDFRTYQENCPGYDKIQERKP